MANIKSKKKNIRKIAKRTAHNRAVKSELKTLSKNVAEAIKAEDMDKVREIAKNYVSALDKAAKSNIIHINKARRHKSAMAKYLMPAAA